MEILDGRVPFGADASKCSPRPSTSLNTPLSKHQLPKSSHPSNSNNGDMKSPKVPGTLLNISRVESFSHPLGWVP